MNMVYFDLDTVRADHLSCYGHHRNTSPYIDYLAARGARFEQCISANIPTQPSHTTLLTGMHGIHHQVVSHGSLLRTADDLTDFPFFTELLWRAGVHTCAFPESVTARHVEQLEVA